MERSFICVDKKSYFCRVSSSSLDFESSRNCFCRVKVTAALIFFLVQSRVFVIFTAKQSVEVQQRTTISFFSLVQKGEIQCVVISKYSNNTIYLFYVTGSEFTR